tara:strand:+ start:293 stop:661 length:369 start_codon:yes stop_codon:yes gene_type:complete
MKYIILVTVIVLVLMYSYIKAKKSTNKLLKRNNKIAIFKKSLLSTESNIKKIYLRNDERINLNPDINIKVDIYDKDYEIINKTNLHRARLAKFKKSKFNGEFIYLDKDEKIYKIIKGVKKYL